ncbi:MAG TPA: HD-GYP domain-containing protein [Thermomicrobiaceae bacterium]|jgi:putative nucleotidyltransferase with HDIG domain|nr:HD-GYP domain-containing protein [Thermomicrobiaceae bacterium]
MRIRIYIAGLVVAAPGCAVALVYNGFGVKSPLIVLALAAIAAYAERVRIKLDSTIEESIAVVPTLFAALLFGPLASMIVAAGSLLPDAIQPPRDIAAPRLRWLTYTCSRSLAAAATGLVAVAVVPLMRPGLLSIVAAATAAAVVAQVLDAGFAALTVWLRRSASVGGVLRPLLPLNLTFILLYTPIVALLVYAYLELSPLTLPLFFVPALAAQRLFVLYQDQRRLSGELLDANQALERVNLSFASALVATLDARDRYTAGHSAAVAVYARDIAGRLGLDSMQQQMAHLAGLVHDIGKIGLPAGLLEKPGALTLDERRQMERHSEIGERILANVETYSEIAAIVRHHHERMDGQGYPDGVNGENIPLIARIIAVADAYDAMTSDRPYRDAMPSRIARLRLAQAADTQFDTTVVAAFEAILSGASEDYRLGKPSASVEAPVRPEAAIPQGVLRLQNAS